MGLGAEPRAGGGQAAEAEGLTTWLTSLHASGSPTELPGGSWGCQAIGLSLHRRREGQAPDSGLGEAQDLEAGED